MLFKVSLLMVFLVLSTVNADSNISKDGEYSEGKKSLMDGIARFFTDEKYMGITPQEIENRIRKSVSSKTKSNRKFSVFLHFNSILLINFFNYFFSLRMENLQF